MVKRRWPFLLGASLIGVAASVVAKRKGTDEKRNWAAKYIGQWQFIHPSQQTHHQLMIDSEFRLYIDGAKVNGTLQELSQERLVWQDQFGYHLKVTADQQQPTFIYDEADDITYPLHQKEVSQ